MDARPAPAFETIIVPHRSLSPRGVRRLIGAICAACGITALGFVALGAWPVAGFTGIEIVLAALLLRLNAAGARASEMVILDGAGLRIVRTDRRGGRTERCLPASWLAVRLQDRPGRVPALLLTAHGQREEVGASLGEVEKRDLAAALQAAVRNWQNPRFDNPQLRD